MGLNGYVGYNVVWNAETWDFGTGDKAVDTTNREIYTKGDQGLNSIEFQQDVLQNFQQITVHSVRLNALLKITLNSMLKFN